MFSIKFLIKVNKHEIEKRQRLEIRPNASARGQTQKRWEGGKVTAWEVQLRQGN